MRTRPHVMLRSIIGAAFGLVIPLTLADPCAGQQNVPAPSDAAAGGNVSHSDVMLPPKKHGGQTVSAPGGVAVGGDIKNSPITINNPPSQSGGR
jgi:hypothetical protein